MKLFRWLFSNIILIAFVLALSYAYVYWDNLMDKDTPVGSAMAWLSEEFEEVGGLFANLKVTGDGPQTDSGKISEDEITEMVALLPQEVAESAPVLEQSAVVQPSGTDRYVTPEIEQLLTHVSDDGVVADAPVEETKSTRELWIYARQSFHRRDFENSINSYEQLISKTPDNYDAYGELGNVYFNQGKIKLAASSYYEAAAILVRLGQVERASSLMSMLSRMDPDKAEKLQELLSSARS